MNRPHARTHDFHPSGTAWQRFNKRVAMAVTKRVGSMNCAWAFTFLALLSLPATLAGFAAFSHVFPRVLVNQHLIALVAWIAQTFIQLVLLSVIMVGQSIQSVAADARAAKTFEDTERIVDSLRLDTEGGLKAVLDAIKRVDEQHGHTLAAVLDALHFEVTPPPTPPQASTPPDAGTVTPDPT